MYNFAENDQKEQRLDDLVDLSGLERMDDMEVETIKRLVSRLFGEFDPRVKIEGVYFRERRYPHTAYQSETNCFVIVVSR